jgi:D-alanine transfer protein
MTTRTYWSSVLIACAIIIAVLLAPESLFVGLLPKQTVEAAADWQDLSRFRNNLFQQASFHDGGLLPFYGSSTIGIFSEFHPSNAIVTPFAPYLQGESACTAIIHVLNLAAAGDSLAGKKLVFMLDPADFMNPKGMSDQRFTDLYSKLSAYEFIFDRNIDAATKSKVAGVLLRYSEPNKDALLRLMLEGMTSGDRWKQLEGVLVRLAAFAEMKIMEKQDVLQALQISGKVKPPRRTPVNVDLSWEQLQAQATKEATVATRNNPYGMLNDYYKTKVLPGLKRSKNSWKPGNYLNSPEYDNFQAILDMLKAERAEPIFVLLPRKGSWSDYIGFTQAYRDQLYAKMKQEANRAGFQMIIDYSSHEYDPYFMRDASHLGWGGWVQLDQDLLKQYGWQSLSGPKAQG